MTRGPKCNCHKCKTDGTVLDIPYNPNLPLYDLHLFGPLEEALEGQDDRVKKMFMQLAAETTHFFHNERTKIYLVSGEKIHF